MWCYENLNKGSDMLEVTGKFTPYSFDGVKFTKKLDKEMGIILRGAIKVWIKTILHTVKRAPHTVGDTFPIQTGAAKASIRPIARYVRVAIPIRPAPKRPNLISKGEASSSFNVQDDKTNPKSFEYRFNWSTDLEHFLLNEFNKMPQVRSETPWKVTVAARKAVQIYIRQEVKKRLRGIKIKDYIITKRG